MEEKVIQVELPEGYRIREIKGEEGIVNIICERKDLPKLLKGATKRYQKDDGNPYWYCMIGKDEFMYLDFSDITEDDLLYDADGQERDFSKFFLYKNDILDAIKNKPKEGYRWISVYEPSMDENGKIQFVSGKDVWILKGISPEDAENILKDYSPENNSQTLQLTTYFLLLVRWLKDGKVTFEQMARDAATIGHFSNSKDKKGSLEKTGEREFGGLFGFVGNTYKVVKNVKTSRFIYMGGCYNNHCFLNSPLARRFRIGSDTTFEEATMLVELF